jgi:hypothetical protein
MICFLELWSLWVKGRLGNISIYSVATFIEIISCNYRKYQLHKAESVRNW